MGFIVAVIVFSWTDIERFEEWQKGSPRGEKGNNTCHAFMRSVPSC